MGCIDDGGSGNLRTYGDTHAKETWRKWKLKGLTRVSAAIIPTCLTVFVCHQHPDLRLGPILGPVPGLPGFGQDMAQPARGAGEVGDKVSVIASGPIVGLAGRRLQIAADTSDSEGKFSLDVPKASKIQLLVQGPAGSAEYVETCYPFWEVSDLQPQELADVELHIMPKAQAEKVIAGLQALGQVDLTKGIIIGVVETASDLAPMSGVKISFSAYQSGDPVDADIVYLGENEKFDPALNETSSQGVFIIYNIGIGGTGSTDLQVLAEKQGYGFPSFPHVTVYAYQASPERVTIVPFEGSESGGGDGGGGGGCLIATAGSGVTSPRHLTGYPR